MTTPHVLARFLRDAAIYLGLAPLPLTPAAPPSPARRSYPRLPPPRCPAAGDQPVR